MTRFRDLGDNREVVTDQQHGKIALFGQFSKEIDNLSLDGDIERCCRFVRDQQLRTACQGHRDHHPLTHPAGKLVPERLQGSARVGQSDLVEKICGHVLRIDFRDVAVGLQHIDDLATDADGGVESRTRVLEDHTDVATAYFPQLGGGQTHKFLSFQTDASAGCCRTGQKTEQSESGQCLSAPALSYEAGDFARPQLEAHSVEESVRNRFCPNVNREVSYLQKWAHRRVVHV